MKKIAVFLAFTSIFLSSVVYSANFSFKSKDGLNFSLTSWVRTTEVEANNFMSLANQDSAEVKRLYSVLVNESKTAKDSTDKPSTYEKLISRGLILEAGVKGFISVLNDAVTKIDKLNDGGANGLNFQPSKTRADVVNDINKILKDMNSTAEQTVKLVSGLNAQYEEIKDKTKDPTLVSKDKIAEHNVAYEKDYTKKPDDNSFIAKNKDKADAEVSDNLVSAGGGRYTRTTGGANNFSEDLNGNKFEVVSAEASVPVTQQPVANNATDTPQQVVVDNSSKTDKQVATPNPTDNSKELGELKDELKKLKDLQTKEKPKASDDSSKSSSPNASNPSLAGLRASYDADRAKREKEMAEQRRLQEAAKIIADAKRKSRLPKTKDIAFSRPASSGGSSLFSSPSYNKEDIKKDTASTNTPSIFERNGIGTSGKKVSDYSSYYGTANIPSSPSSKELAMNRFSSMYEMARRKALIEDARSEFAGRYIDIFLLQHSIIYDYYSRGLLIDLAEAVEPIGDSDTL